MNNKAFSPVTTCGAFSNAEKGALKKVVDNLRTVKIVEAAAAYNGVVTPLSFYNLVANAKYKVSAVIGTAAAETITINIPAVNYLLGVGFSTDVGGTDTTAAEKLVKLTATDPALTMNTAQAGAAVFDFVFSPSAEGSLLVQTSASETIGAGSYVCLERID